MIDQFTHAPNGGDCVVASRTYVVDSDCKTKATCLGYNCQVGRKSTAHHLQVKNTKTMKLKIAMTMSAPAAWKEAEGKYRSRSETRHVDRE